MTSFLNSSRNKVTPPPKPVVTAGGGVGAIARAAQKAAAKVQAAPVATVAAAVEKARAAAAPAAPAAPVTPVKAVTATKVTPTAPVKIDTSGLEKEFAVARDRISQHENAVVQAQRDAIARRAAMGGGGISGALQKQESLAMDESAQRLGDASAQIDAAKAGELRKVADRETELNFQAQQADIQRQFAADEAAAGRQSSADALNADLDLKQKAMAIQQSQFAQQMAQSLKAFDWEKFIDQENLKLAAKIQALNEQEDPGLLGMGGMLGTGIGGNKGLLGTGVLAKGKLVDTSNW